MTVDGDDNDNGWMAITMMAVTMITTAMMMMAMALNVQTACRLGRLDDDDDGMMTMMVMALMTIITMMLVTMIIVMVMKVMAVMMMVKMMAMLLNVQTACRLGLVQISPVNISHLSNFFEQIVQFSSDDSDTEPQHAFLALRFGTSDELVCIFVVLYFKLVYFCKSYKFGLSKNYLRFIHLDLCKNIPFLDPELFPQKSHV